MPDEIFINKTDALLLLDALDWASDAMAHSPYHEQQDCKRAVDQAWVLLREHIDDSALSLPARRAIPLLRTALLARAEHQQRSAAALRGEQSR